MTTKKTTALAIKPPAEVKQLDVLVTQAQSLLIESPKDMQDATTFLSTLNKFNDKITTEKEKVTKPLNAALKAERERWKFTETKLAGAIAFVRRKMTDYQTAAVKKQQEEEAAIAARVGPGKGKISVETAVKRMDEVEVAEGVVTTDAGAVQFRAVQKFEVEDIQKLPWEFLVPNEVKIREAMKAGTAVPGVRYYEEQVPYNTR